MDVVRLVHLACLFMWAGLILGETVVEALGRDPAAQPFAARAHFWMDVCCELPLLVAIVTSGAILTARVWPLSTVHWIKLAAGLLAIAANLYCAVLVALRYLRRGDRAALAALTVSIRWTWVAVPVGLLALVLGLRFA